MLRFTPPCLTSKPLPDRRMRQYLARPAIPPHPENPGMRART